MNKSQINEVRPARGLVGDIHRARSGASATADELREFVKQLHGRSPQEMLGIVAGSSLVRSTVLASVITLVFMVGFTVGPYAWNKMYPKSTTTAAAAPAAATTSSTAAPTTAAAQAPAAANAQTAAPSTPATGPSSATNNAAGASSNMPSAVPSAPPKQLGVSDAKYSDPKKNPLENSADDLLKDFK